MPLQTTDGRSIDLIHLGSWTHGLGPDFRDALFAIDGGKVIAGSIELHLRSRGWIEHGHHLDPAYNLVELHVVGQYDPVEIRRADGKLIPSVVLNLAMTGTLPPPADWTRVGGEVCAEHLAVSHAAEIRAILGRLGDERLSARVAMIEARLQTVVPDAALYELLLDAFGFATNRAAMATVSDRASWEIVASLLQRERFAFPVLAALLLGVGGFLPMSDVEMEKVGLGPDLAADITERWHKLRQAYDITPIMATTWNLARLRPGNHPGLRLVQAAALLAATGGQLAGTLLASVREGSDPTSALQEMVGGHIGLRLGADRARAITTNVLVPFAFAFGQHGDDQQLLAKAGELWEVLSGAESNELTRRATRQVSGAVGIRRQGARIQQGLIHLDRTLCEPRRCFSCPIATMVLAE